MIVAVLLFRCPTNILSERVLQSIITMSDDSAYSRRPSLFDHRDYLRLAGSSVAVSAVGTGVISSPIVSTAQQDAEISSDALLNARKRQYPIYDIQFRPITAL